MNQSPDRIVITTRDADAAVRSAKAAIAGAHGAADPDGVPGPAVPAAHAVRRLAGHRVSADPARAGRDITIQLLIGETAPWSPLPVIAVWTVALGAVALWAYRRDEGLRYR